MAAKEKNIELSELFVAFEDLEDPRSSINRLHPLVSVPSIALLAVLCGADGPISIRGWAAARQQFLERFLVLPNDLPSRELFRRVLYGLQPVAFQRRFNVWIEAMRAVIDAQILHESSQRTAREEGRNLGPTSYSKYRKSSLSKRNGSA